MKAERKLSVVFGNGLTLLSRGQRASFCTSAHKQQWQRAGSLISKVSLKREILYKNILLISTFGWLHFLKLEFVNKLISSRFILITNENSSKFLFFILSEYTSKQLWNIYKIIRPDSNSNRFFCFSSFLSPFLLSLSSSLFFSPSFPLIPPLILLLSLFLSISPKSMMLYNSWSSPLLRQGSSLTDKQKLDWTHEYNFKSLKSIPNLLKQCRIYIGEGVMWREGVGRGRDHNEEKSLFPPTQKKIQMKI